MVYAPMKLDETASPIAIDYLNLGSRRSGRSGGNGMTLGVLDWVGDELRICMAKAGDPRPKDFACDGKSGRTLSQWRRA
jgi:hypothetical protein